MSRPEAEDESIRDLRRAILAQGEGADYSSCANRATTPPAHRARAELLDPEIGRLRDVAQPGGFRRQHVIQQGKPGEYASSSLVQLLDPRLVPFLALPQLGPKAGDGKGDAAANDYAKMVDSSSSNWQVAVFMAKSCVGTAVLIMPRGYKSAGVIGAPAILIFVYIFMLYGMLKLIDVRKAWGKPARYCDLGEALGSWGKGYIMDQSCMLVFGFNCIWCVTCQENLKLLFHHWTPAARLWLLFPAVASLSLVRKLRYFAITNFIGIVFVMVTVVYLIYFATEELRTRGRAPTKVVNPGTDMILWIGTCGYIFECICIVVPLYDSAKDKESVGAILTGVTAGVLSLYIVFGMLFYSAFGEATADVAILNLPTGSRAGVMVPVLFSLVAIATMPLNNVVLFQSYEPQYDWPAEYHARKWMKNGVRVLVCVSIYVVTELGGEELQNFLALVGGLLGMNLALSVPALLHLVVCKPVGWARAFDIATFCVGACVMVVSTYCSLKTWGGKTM